jgi:hypothetical protein
VKTLAWLLPWLLVAVAALVWAIFVVGVPTPVEQQTWLGNFWDVYKGALASMVLGALLFWFGNSIGQGMEEGLKSRQQPGQK